MRLINTRAKKLVNAPETCLPSYAILSHTWGNDDDEVSLPELQGILNSPIKSLAQGLFRDDGLVKPKPGLLKIRGCSKAARNHQLDYIWIDTCCIDKTSSAELSEAINSMYRWYQQSDSCFVYLADVTAANDFDPIYVTDPEAPANMGVEGQLRESRWFTRGWTLQEVVAPREVYFFDKGWTYLGAKTKSGWLRSALSRITGISEFVLAGLVDISELSIAARMQWASARRTTRVEDMAYCLMGLFDVNMPLLYGEGDRAFIRLQEEIIKVIDDQSIFAWASGNNRFNNDEPGLSGLLAPSPRCFRETGMVRPLPSATSGEPSMPTNRGLRVRLNIYSGLPDLTIAILECYPLRGKATDNLDIRTTVLSVDGHKTPDWVRARQYYSLAIYLQRLGGDQYARIHTNAFGLVLPHLAEAVNGSELRTVYIKQNAQHRLPDILVRIGSQRNGFQDNEITFDSVHPEFHFSPESNVLRSSPGRLLGVMGAFRFRAQSPAEPSAHSIIDVIVGLRLSRYGEWECWHKQSCWDHEAQLSDLPPLFVVSEDFSKYFAQEKTDPSISTVSLSMAYGRKLAIVDFGHGMGLETENTLHRAELEAHDVPHLHTLQRLDFRYANDKKQDLGAYLGRDFAILTERLTIDDSLGLGVLPVKGWRSAFHPDKVRINKPGCPESSPVTLGLSQLLDTLEQSDIRVMGASIADEQHVKSLVLSGDADSVRSMAFQESLRSIVVCDNTARNVKNGTDFPNIALQPLAWCVLQGRYRLARVLVEKHHVSMNVMTTNDLSLIHLAALSSHAEVFDLLRDESMRIKTDLLLQSTGSFGDTAAHFVAAYRNGWDERGLILEVLARNEHGQLQLTQNKLGETPLHRAAAMRNNLAMASILSQLDAEATSNAVNCKDNSGRTPLWHATAANAVEEMYTLLGAGASVDEPDAYGRSPLLEACIEGHEAAVRLLLESGADARRRMRLLGVTATQFCALFGHAGCLQALLAWFSSRSDLPHRSRDEGASDEEYLDVAPIHLAASNGWIECVKLLCDFSSDNIMVPCEYLVLIDPEAIVGAVRVFKKETESPMEAASICRQQQVHDFLSALL